MIFINFSGILGPQNLGLVLISEGEAVSYKPSMLKAS
jgi:hypothetical protein